MVTTKNGIMGVTYLYQQQCDFCDKTAVAHIKGVTFFLGIHWADVCEYHRKKWVQGQLNI